MKTNKQIALGLIATTAIVSLGFTSALAIGNGQGAGNGLGKMVTSEEKEKLQSMSENERQEYMNELKVKYNITSGRGEEKGRSKSEGNKGGKDAKEGHSPTEMLNDIEKQDVSTVEIALLEKQYEEEMMSNELYMSFYEMYGIEIFKKVAESEAKHMEAVQALLDRYDIEAPTDYDHIKDLYETLKEAGSQSVFDALEVGVKIEFVDIDDIITAVKTTDNNDIKVVFTNIGGASYNHLRGFLKDIDNNSYETELDWQKYISEDDRLVTGPIKYKLAEKLESEGVQLPKQVSSESMKNKKCDKKDDKHGDNEKGEKKGKDNSKEYSQNKSQIDTYKNTINAKYATLIAKLDDEKLKSISIKIDNLLVKTTSEKTKLILVALKEIIEENIDSTNLDIDGLLN